MISPVSRIRTCIIGAGASARKHIVGWQAVNDSQVVAVVDLDEARANGLAQEFGIDTVSTDYSAVISRADINIVSLCTPSALHGPIALDAIKNHKHIFCERNTTHVLGECDTLLATARRNRVAVGMSFPRRYSPSFTHIREMLNDDKLGRPVIYRVHCLMPAPSSMSGRSETRDTKVFLDLFADHYDLWAWLFRSDVVRVNARGFSWAELESDQRKRLGTAPDTGVALIEYGSGDIGVITASCSMQAGFKPFLAHEEELIGPQGVVTNIQPTQFRHIDHQGRVQEYGFQPHHAYTAAIKEFAIRIRRGEPPRVSGDDGRRALRVGLAVTESMESGETVEY